MIMTCYSGTQVNKTLSKTITLFHYLLMPVPGNLHHSRETPWCTSCACRSFNAPHVEMSGQVSKVGLYNCVGASLMILTGRFSAPQFVAWRVFLWCSFLFHISCISGLVLLPVLLEKTHLQLCPLLLCCVQFVCVQYFPSFIYISQAL